VPGSVLAAATQALDALAAVDVATLSGAELKQLVLGVDGLRRRLAAIEAAGLAAFDASAE